MCRMCKSWLVYIVWSNSCSLVRLVSCVIASIIFVPVSHCAAKQASLMPEAILRTKINEKYLPPLVLPRSPEEATTFPQTPYRWEGAGCLHPSTPEFGSCLPPLVLSTMRWPWCRNDDYRTAVHTGRRTSIYSRPVYNNAYTGTSRTVR